jgi:hypothetical protein
MFAILRGAAVLRYTPRSFSGVARVVAVLSR